MQNVHRTLQEIIENSQRLHTRSGSANAEPNELGMLSNSWKHSILTPLHKNKDKESLKNYRPISNLVSISKLFEKIILVKIATLYPGIEGQHQHGFRSNRGTNPALLEIQNIIASALDSNRHAITYSIDMSALFDLLRSGIFRSEVETIDSGLMNVLIDFMSNRHMAVRLGEYQSSDVAINVYRVASWGRNSLTSTVLGSQSQSELLRRLLGN